MREMELSASDIERFWRRVEKSPDCWLWSGATFNGYGQFSARLGGVNRSLRAHRVAFAFAHGGLDAGCILDHICRVRNCVNPEHLRITTNRDNVLAGIGPTANNARKTHCVNGHEYSQATTRVTKTGERRCRECVRIWAREAASKPTVCKYCGETVRRSNTTRHRRAHHPETGYYVAALPELVKR